jgi:hypothetical protein
VYLVIIPTWVILLGTTFFDSKFVWVIFITT